MFLSLLFLSVDVSAQYFMDDTTEVSILIGGPSEEEVFTVYGHAAIRVQNPNQKMDYLFNYGIFDFSKPNFVYRFAKGETDYRLGIIRYEDYVAECRARGCSLTELVLDLTHKEKNKIFQALIENSKPENRVYRYNFFFDNCATRPVDILREQLDGSLLLLPQTTDTCTFREIINHATRHKPWLTLGCDLALGSPTDRRTTAEEQLFLPAYMQTALEGARVKDYADKERPLVKKTTVLVEENLPAVEDASLSPTGVAWVLFLLSSVLFIYAAVRGKTLNGFCCVVFALEGIAGCLLWYISLVSEHPCVFPNWNLLLFHPFHLLFAVVFAVKGCKRFATYYHFTNFVALSLLFFAWALDLQHRNDAFLPLAGILLAQSLYGVQTTKTKD